VVNEFRRAARLLFVALISSTAAAPVEAAVSGSGQADASASILINATPKVVWSAVHRERFQDPDLAYVTVLGKTAGSTLMEEKFISVPILGSVTAVLKQDEEPFKQIHYSLVRSDKFKRMEGTWVLTPVAGGKQTMLKLSSFLDVGVPFSGPFIRSATQRKITCRIANVKRMAEARQAELSALGRNDE
jgi:hypothetical protein